MKPNKHHPFSWSVFFAAAFLLAGFGAVAVHAQEFDSALYSGMRWRIVGPFRAGRALAASGVPGQPDVFYFGSVDGGVWKTTDAGRTWNPIFDGESIASIGALAIAPSDPNVIYVGTGEADMRSDISYGNGMYKSTDAGRTWTHIGLDDTEQIGCVLVDPHDPNRVYVAALGHAYGPNKERGVFRSTDGGRTWQKILYKDENTGAIDLAFQPGNSRVIYASLWQTRRPPWNVYPPSNGPGSGLYKTTDGGDTWRHLTGHGLPSEGLGRIGISVPPANPNRVYLIVDARQGGLYRSDDAGETWKLMDNDRRIWGRGWYFGGVTADPKNPDFVYVCNTSTYRSENGGKTFTAFKGAPGGDDYHLLWIEPNNPSRMIVASDQGAVVSVNGGKTWSSWYNQPTAQLYHIITDNRFPYWIYAAQQDSGAVAIPSRTQYKGINSFSWRPMEPGGESEYIAPDPLDPNVIFGGTEGTEADKFNLETGDDQQIPPTLAHRGVFRSTWTLPLVFSPADSHALYFGSQVMFVTRDGGSSWQIISPDLTRENPGVPPNLDPTTAADTTGNGRRGVIYTIAPSPLDKNTIWAGTDDGLIQITRDGGKSWQNVTPPALTPWSKVSLMDASHFDVNTAYAAVDRHRLDDFRPYIYRTHDGGKTWQEVSRGIPNGDFVRVVREDPERKGLLYAGTERGVFVSFDDGDNWQSLQLNLPVSSVRDLIIHGNDLIAGTHGRSIWILDDVTPLRQIDSEVAASDAFLFKPQKTYRIRSGSTDEGTPLPPEEPTGENPPNGAILDYYLKSKPTGPVALEIDDAQGKLVKRYSSAETPQAINPAKLSYPAFWIHPEQPLSAEPGMHRFVWNLLYPEPPTPAGFDEWAKSGLWAPPGHYTVKLMVNGKTQSQPLTVVMDPRVKVTQADLERQFQTAMQIVAAREKAGLALKDAETLRKELAAISPEAKRHEDIADSIHEIERKLLAIIGPERNEDADYSGEFGPASDVPSLRHLTTSLGRLQYNVESADAAPTADALTAFSRDRTTLESLLSAWSGIKTGDLPKLNELLRKANLPPLKPGL